MKKIFTAWGLKDDLHPHTLAVGKKPPLLDKDKSDPDCEKVFWKIETNTWEEAMSIHYLRLGFAPYKPMGKAKPCPNCGAIFYPDGSGECWSCAYEC